jgi:hypothetical protein
MTRMTKSLMPKGGAGSGKESRRRGRKLQWIEGTRTVTPDDLSPRMKILHRTTKRVKLHRTIIIGGKLTN